MRKEPLKTITARKMMRHLQLGKLPKKDWPYLLPIVACQYTAVVRGSRRIDGAQSDIKRSDTEMVKRWSRRDFSDFESDDEKSSLKL